MKVLKYLAGLGDASFPLEKTQLTHGNSIARKFPREQFLIICPSLAPASESGIWVALMPVVGTIDTLVPPIRFGVSPSLLTGRKSYHQKVSRAVLYQS